MAIDKEIENEFGAEFNYHKLREVRIVNDDNVGIQLVMTVYSWVNKQARISGKQPTVRQCIIMAADFAMTPFYALLKAKFPEFTEGTDDFDNSFKVMPGGRAEFIEQTAAGKLLGRWQEAQLEENEQNETQAEEPVLSEENEAGEMPEEETQAGEEPAAEV